MTVEEVFLICENWREETCITLRNGSQIFYEGTYNDMPIKYDFYKVLRFEVNKDGIEMWVVKGVTL